MSTADVAGRPSATQVRSRFVELPGHRVHLLEAGEGAAVLHLHGTSTSAQSHLPLLEHLPHVHSFAVDRPGSGTTTGAPLTRSGYRRHVVDFLDRLLDGLGLRSASLAGASGGGAWSLWYTLARPERVDALVLLGAVPTLFGTRVPLPVRLTAVPLIGEAIDRVVPATRATVIRFMAVMGEGDTITRHPALLDGLVAARSDRATLAATRAEFRVFITPGGHWRRELLLTAADLGRVRARTLMVWGEHDPVGGSDVARAVAAALPRAHLQLLPAGHVPWLGDPDRVGRLLTRHVTAGTGPGPAAG